MHPDRSRRNFGVVAAPIVTSGGSFSSDPVLRPVAVCLVMLLALPLGAQTQPAEAARAPSEQTQQSDRAPQGPVPQSPAPASQNAAPAGTSGDPNKTPVAPVIPPWPAAPPAQAPAPAPAAAAQPGAPQQPVGTAAAPYERGIGVPASRPAGVVIAPAKQRRAHSILIKVSLIAAAAVAVGTVIALSTASPSRPH